MSFISPSRRAPGASPGVSPTAPTTDSNQDAGLGVRSGAGIPGLARPETAAKAPPAEVAEASSQGTLIVGEAGGRVSGSLRYGELCIERGGRLSGDVDLLVEEEAPENEAPRKPDTREAAKAAVSKAQAEGRTRADAESELEQKKREMIAR